jgi:acyl-coenzyme A synthetase/AMP-(fatty) acid ligase
LEIERELLSHPKVLEAAVLGIKDLELGEKIIAILCLRPEFNTNDVSVIHKEMDEHLATRLVKYKQPRKYVLADHLPRNHLGKV